MLIFSQFYAEYRFKKDRKRRKRQRLKEKKDKIILKAKSVPCTDCDTDLPPEELQFDHLRDKEFNIGGCRGRRNIGIKKLLNEIAKCEVVCDDCHTARELSRGRPR